MNKLQLATRLRALADFAERTAESRNSSHDAEIGIALAEIESDWERTVLGPSKQLHACLEESNRFTLFR